LIFKCCTIKKTKCYEVQQNGCKIQIAVENLCFRIFVLKGTISVRFQNPLLHLKCIFGILHLWKKPFSGNQNGRLVQDGVIFEKIDFSLSGAGHR
jgi:hypothetical protein